MIMVRENNKATKIAFKILGTPPNIAFKPTPKQKELDRLIMYKGSTGSRG